MHNSTLRAIIDYKFLVENEILWEVSIKANTIIFFSKTLYAVILIHNIYIIEYTIAYDYDPKSYYRHAPE